MFERWTHITGVFFLEEKRHPQLQEVAKRADESEMVVATHCFVYALSMITKNIPKVSETLTEPPAL